MGSILTKPFLFLSSRPDPLLFGNPSMSQSTGCICLCWSLALQTQSISFHSLQICLVHESFKRLAVLPTCNNILTFVLPTLRGDFGVIRRLGFWIPLGAFQKPSYLQLQDSKIGSHQQVCCMSRACMRRWISLIPIWFL